MLWKSNFIFGMATFSRLDTKQLFTLNFDLFTIFGHGEIAASCIEMSLGEIWGYAIDFLW